MRRNRVAFSGLALLALAATALPLAGCSTFDGISNFGSAQPALDAGKDVADLGNLTADQALSEARGHFKTGDYGYSAAAYKRVVELAPKDPEGYVGLGASYDRLVRFDLADRVYASLYSLTGGTAQYYNNVGYSNLLRGNLTAALANFRKAKRLDPDNVVVANNLQIIANAAGASPA